MATGCKSHPNGSAGNMGGSPKSITDGKDTGPHATNSGPKVQNTPISPNANRASATNKGR